MSAKYHIYFSKIALKYFNQLDKTTKIRIATAIEKLAIANPYPAGCKKLVATDDHYRIRVGDYRIIYQVKDTIITIYILKIGHRKEIYKKS